MARGRTQQHRPDPVAAFAGTPIVRELLLHLLDSLRDSEFQEIGLGAGGLVSARELCVDVGAVKDLPHPCRERGQLGEELGVGLAHLGEGHQLVADEAVDRGVGAVSGLDVGGGAAAFGPDFAAGGAAGAGSCGNPAAPSSAQASARFAGSAFIPGASSSISRRTIGGSASGPATGRQDRCRRCRPPGGRKPQLSATLVITARIRGAAPPGRGS